MSISINMFMLAGRNWLKNHYAKSFNEFSSCCGECWCCHRKKAILYEFEKKGFETFNSNVNCWKVYNFLNLFEIFPCIELTDSLKKLFFL